ncbi:MAG: serine protease [Myxococcota bacterium]
MNHQDLLDTVVLLTTDEFLEPDPDNASYDFRRSSLQLYKELNNNEQNGGCGENTYLCLCEPFQNETVIRNKDTDNEEVWRCTGVMVANNLVLTASHCIGSLKERSHDLIAIAGVRDFTQPIAHANRREVKEIIYREYWGEVKDDGRDLVLLRLEPDLSGTRPSAEVSSRPLELGDGLFTIGFPRGLPLTFAGCAQVAKCHKFSAFSNLDAMWSNSGSPVFDLQGKLVGIIAKTGSITRRVRRRHRAPCCQFERRKDKKHFTVFSKITHLQNIIDFYDRKK